MKLYTRKGDDGKTHLSSGPRVSKDDPHIEACGTVDELNAQLGLVRCESLPQDIDQLLRRVQHELFCLGADLAKSSAITSQERRITAEHVQQLESDIDTLDARVPPLTEFILPGGVRSAALGHVARTICRRAERRVVRLEATLSECPHQSPALEYLNRLGDLLFVLPRALNAHAQVPDECWQKDGLTEGLSNT